MNRIIEHVKQVKSASTRHHTLVKCGKPQKQASKFCHKTKCLNELAALKVPVAVVATTIEKTVEDQDREEDRVVREFVASRRPDRWIVVV